MTRKKSPSGHKNALSFLFSIALIISLITTVYPTTLTITQAHSLQEDRDKNLVATRIEPNYPFGHTNMANYSAGSGGSLVEISADVENASKPDIWSQWCWPGGCSSPITDPMTSEGGNTYSYQFDGTKYSPQASSDGSFPSNCTIHYEIIDGEWNSSQYEIYFFWPPGSANLSADHVSEVYPEQTFWVNGSVEYNSTNNTGNHAMMENSPVNITLKNSSWSDKTSTETNRTGVFSEKITAPSRSGRYALNITAKNETWDVEAYYSSQIDVVDLTVYAELNKTTTLPGSSIEINGTASFTNGDTPVGADVNVSINGTGLVDTTVDSNGEFEGIFSSPEETGNYSVNVTVNHTDSGLLADTSLPLEVTKISEPEISVTDLQLNPSESILEGNEIEVIATVKNSGSGGAQFDVELSLDSKDNVIDSENISLSPGSTKEVYFYLQLDAGDHTVWVTADPTIDDNPDDNVKEKSFQVIERKPELYLDDFQLVEREEILEADEVDLNFTINNTGNESVELPVAFSIGKKDNVTEWFTVYVGQDERRSIEFNWTAVSGEHKLWLIADPNGSLGDMVKVKERNLTITVSKRIAELRLRNVRVFPKENISRGQKVFVEAEVFNIGNEMAEFDIAVALDSKDNVSSWEHIELRPGGSKNINTSFISSSNLHSIWIIADYNRTVEERLKSDNTYYSPLGSVSGEPEVQTGKENGTDLLPLVLLLISGIVMALAILVYLLHPDKIVGKKTEEVDENEEELQEDEAEES